MNTAEDDLYDGIENAVAQYCVRKGLRTGVATISAAMRDTAEAEAADLLEQQAKQLELVP